MTDAKPSERLYLVDVSRKEKALLKRCQRQMDGEPELGEVIDVLARAYLGLNADAPIQRPRTLEGETIPTSGD